MELRSPRGRALMALLIVHRGEAVAADALAQALWGDEAPSTAATALRVSVSRLRRALGPAAEQVQTIGGGYRLRVEGAELDAARFERGYDDGRRLLAAGRAAEAVAALRDALALWRGPALADLRYAPWAQAEMRRLEELRAAALEEWIEAELALGEHARLLGTLDALVAEHPLRERLRAQQMLALYRSGRHADALAVFRDTREMLDAELGLEPGPELRALEQAILTHDPALSSPGHVDAPPAPPTPTIGREGDVRAVLALLADARLLTLTGAGGVGKTRIAIEVARAADGRFVSLASVSDTERIPAKICDALAVARVPGETDERALERALGRGRVLLVLDNLEHLVGAAPLLARLLERHADLRILATSRQPVRIQAERLYPVPPLGVRPAVALFTDRARARDPSFVLTDETAPAVAKICERVGCLPLAIELAAARLGLLTPTELAERLDDSLAVLDQGPSDAPERQRTLRATLDWSFELLEPAERDAFTALAVFAGGCSVDAAEAVTGAGLSVLEGLVAKCLVSVRDGRLTMLEPVRQYAAERLAARPDAHAVHARHLAYYTALAERCEAAIWVRLRSCPQFATLRREHDNLRTAMAWGLAAGGTGALQLVAAVGYYMWYGHQPTEFLRWCEQALATAGADVPEPVRARVLLARGTNALEPVERLNDKRAALTLLRRVGDERSITRCLADLALDAIKNQDPGARMYAEEALRHARRLNDDALIGVALAELARATPDVETSLGLAREATVHLRSADALDHLAQMLSDLGFAALRQEAYERAERVGLEALETALAIGDAYTTVLARGNLALAWLLRGSHDAAREGFELELVIAHAHGFPMCRFEALLGLAALAANDGDDRRAATLEAAAMAARDRPVLPVEVPIYERVRERFIAPARERLGATAWESASAAGRGLTAEEAIAFALESAAVVPTPLPD